MSRQSLRVALLALALTPPIHAQTTDPVFRSWEWETEAQSVRGAGLSGAVLALATDAGTAVLNPASLSLISQVDLRVSLRYSAPRPIGQDQLLRGWTLAQGALARPVGLGSGWGVYYRSPRAVELEIVGAGLPDGSSDAGRLRVRVEEVGGAFGTALGPRLRVGLRLGAARLDLGGSVVTVSAGGDQTRASVVGESWQPSAGINVLLTPDHRFRAGLTYDTGTRFGARRSGSSGAFDYDMVVPPRLAAGVLVRTSTAVSLTGQLDWLRWSRVEDALVSASDRPPATEYGLDDAVEGRLGVEFRAEYGESLLWNRAVVRLGLHFRSRGVLEYRGSDPVEQARFPGQERTTEWSLGFGFGPLEVARVRRQHSRDWLIGVRHSF